MDATIYSTWKVTNGLYFSCSGTETAPFFSRWIATINKSSIFTRASTNGTARHKTNEYAFHCDSFIFSHSIQMLDILWHANDKRLVHRSFCIRKCSGIPWILPLKREQLTKTLYSNWFISAGTSKPASERVYIQPKNHIIWFCLKMRCVLHQMAYLNLRIKIVGILICTRLNLYTIFGIISDIPCRLCSFT